MNFEDFKRLQSRRGFFRDVAALGKYGYFPDQLGSVHLDVQARQ